MPQFFHMNSFRVEVERRHNAKGELVTVSQAVIKVRVGDAVAMQVSEGNGPVNALDDLGAEAHIQIRTGTHIWV